MRATDLAVVMPHDIAQSFMAGGGYAIVEVESEREALEIAMQFMELHRVHWPEFEGESELRPFETGAPGSE